MNHEDHEPKRDEPIAAESAMGEEAAAGSKASFIPLSSLGLSAFRKPKLDREGVLARLNGKRGKTYWRSLEELAGTEEFNEYLQQEFPRQAPGEWEPLKPKLVVEVSYDHVSDARFRHGTRLLRWRPDKAPAQCTFDQLQREARPAELLRQLGN